MDTWNENVSFYWALKRFNSFWLINSSTTFSGFTQRGLSEKILLSDKGWELKKTINISTQTFILFHSFSKVPQLVGNKPKGRISKRVVQENKACQIFQKTNISYPLIRTPTAIKAYWRISAVPTYHKFDNATRFFLFLLFV